MISRPTRTISGLVLCATFALAGCKQEVRFTASPQAAPASAKAKSAKPRTTTVYAGIDLDGAGLRARVNEAVPQRIINIVEWVSRSACHGSGAKRVCESTRFDMLITRDGSMRLEPDGRSLRLIVPLRYAMKQKGLRSAAFLRREESGRLVATARLGANLRKDFNARLSLSETLKISKPVFKVNAGRINIAQRMAPRLRRMLGKAVAAVEADLNARPIEKTVASVWSFLRQPRKLEHVPGTPWLASAPVAVVSSGFGGTPGTIVFKVGIAAHMALAPGSEPDTPRSARRPRFAAPKSEHARATSLRMPVTVPYGGIGDAIKLAWRTPVDVAATGDAMPMRITVNEAAAFPSGDRIAVELDLDVRTNDRIFDLTGKAFVTARPVMLADHKTLGLSQVQLAPVIPIVGIGQATGQRLRLRAEPFARVFADVIRYDLTAHLATVLPRANRLIDGLEGEGLYAHGRFTRLRVPQVKPLREGFDVRVDVVGEVMFMTRPPMRQAGSPLGAQTR
ncbi:MAG: DUF4403 family protein [Pseudomonadota bacterium]